MQRRRHAGGLLLPFLLLACRGPDETARPESVAVVREAFVTASSRDDDIDSLAFWQGPEGGAWILATAKATDRILVYDARDGSAIGAFGSTGQGPGEFRRPNGIAVVGDLAIVVERDNARVQMLRLPHFTFVATLGEAALRRPYGIAAFESAPGRIELFVTDDDPRLFGLVPVARDPEQRVKHYRIRMRSGRIASELVRTFGVRAGPGVLRKVESIAADADQGLLLIADERTNDLEVYTFAGDHVRSLGQGLFRGEPEGIALYACGERGGYWIVTDQHDPASIFHVLDRTSLEHRGAFSGRVVGHTDGVALVQRPIGDMRAGALYAVHDDRAVGAFDWTEVARALGLRSGCLPGTSRGPSRSPRSSGASGAHSVGPGGA